MAFTMFSLALGPLNPNGVWCLPLEYRNNLASLTLLLNSVKSIEKEDKDKERKMGLISFAP